MLSAFDLIAILIVLTAIFGWLNHVFIGLPHAIGLLVLGLASSLILIGLEVALPNISLYDDLRRLLRQIDFQEAVLNGMLAFLLFAGALHVNLAILKSRAWAVGLMATVGVVISTGVVGVGFWWLSALLGAPVPLAWSLVFGALISPTDPVAVLSTLKSVSVPKTLEADMAGESLFNDGVGVVIFTVIVAIAAGASNGAVEVTQVAHLFVFEALGGAILGLITGYVAYRATRAIDDYPIETLISLALVMGTYALASKLHMSGQIAVVVAGILIGNQGPRDAMSDETQRYLFAFWTLIDEVLNSVLFLLIGLEVLVLSFDRIFLWPALCVIPLVLLARFLAVSIPVMALSSRTEFVKGTIPILTWGGLRGGISIALALSLPTVAEKPILLAATYAAVIFTIVVQGLSLRAVVERFSGPR
ncbi:cation:proton antiporter [Bosea sp. PAMC 26642]|uniref:cation:proton antiporter n=1 Tax=Bosea sp. (strain PAMC 26642) TaxID=1792307 RepID=UPI0007704857|nr:sodium:proton antiporter [Bosea sp. PAMC 26642]AMJ59596.1 sodium:proton antiporter [Bosea sp. PAMC 26642]